ncbi:four-carbon acid sugar kinase family protein [Pleomorphovibrio marinus]|uniref:four-carbon acid sugar kinase family protein n=1 Tax=Pleomorphovibrio marinus TaxID=2164132 RepID=UPI000E0BD774|nr:four-carbon acid sugar kinase family protein [Pleomorphovibrio marinus]
MDKARLLERPHTAEIAALFKRLDCTLVVVDDDPTGTQTVHDVPVLGHWSEQAFLDEFKVGTPLLFVLANTRSLTQTKAMARAREIGQNIKKASEQIGRKFLTVSRSDSTLRGHFPEEVYALTEGAGQSDLPIILTPAFFEGGRVTMDDTHYILEEDTRIPVAETPFAKDKSFGYSHSNLKMWTEEKTKGKVKASEVKSLSLSQIASGQELIANVLKQLKPGEVLVLNAANYTDMEAFVLALHKVLIEGKRFAFRTGASFVCAFGGIGPKPWVPETLPNPSHGGLVVVGSYVPKSTRQLEELLKAEGLFAVPLSVERIIHDANPLINEIDSFVDQLESKINQGITPVVYTSRELVSGSTSDESLAIGEKVNDFLVTLVERLSVQPSFIIGKGGITSNDLAVKSLKMKRGMVVGQVLAGVPVWELGTENKFPSTPYVVFPGNVGDDKGLYTVYHHFNQTRTSL